MGSTCKHLRPIALASSREEACGLERERKEIGRLLEIRTKQLQFVSGQAPSPEHPSRLIVGGISTHSIPQLRKGRD